MSGKNEISHRIIFLSIQNTHAENKNKLGKTQVCTARKAQCTRAWKPLIFRKALVLQENSE